MRKAISTILALSLIITLCGAAWPGAAARASGGIVISDPALESRIREALGIPDGPVTAEDAARLDWLDLSADPNSPEDTRVRDLSSLRFFPNLAGIRLDNNLVSDISPLLDLPNLRELWLLENPLDNLEPLGALTGLVKLGFSARMQDVRFIGNLTELEELRMDGCRELPRELTGLKKLKVFCSLGGELSDISLLSQIPTLSAVDLSWNLVTDLTPLADLPLTELYLQGNPIEDFSPIKELYPKLLGRNFEYIEMKQPEDPALVITFPDPVMEMKVRKALNIPQGDITAGDAAKVTRLDIGNEWQPQIPPEVQVRDLAGIEHFISLRELHANFNAIGDISPLAGLTELTSLNLGGNAFSDISPLAGLARLENLTLFGNHIGDISPLAGLTSLRSLHLGGIQLADLDALAALTGIDHLYAGGCGIEDIGALAGMTNMHRLELSDNYITDLRPLAGMTNLIKLTLANNPIGDYSPIEALYPNLQEKDFELGQVFDVQVPLKPDNPDEPVTITDAGLEAILREVTEIFDRPLTRRDLSNIWKIIDNSDGRWAQVSDITPLKYCLNMDGLVIYGSRISDLSPLSGLTKMHVLTVSDSLVEDLSPLGSLTQLVNLGLKGNRISDVSALQALTGLERLDLANNQIMDFSPLFGLGKLNVLFIGNNPAKDTTGFEGIFSQLNEKDFQPGIAEEPTAQLDQPKDPDKVIKIPDKVMERRVREAIGKPEGKITAGDTAMVEDLNLGNEYQDKFPKGSQISDLSGIEYFINLKRLDISWNKIKDIKKLSGLSKLEYLRAFGNQISSVAPLKTLSNLNSLNIGGNKLTKIDALKELANLKSLYLDGNKIKDFSPIASIYPHLEDKDFTIDIKP